MWTALSCRTTTSTRCKSEWLRGGFSERDESSQRQLVIVNETLARRLWPDRSPLGQRIYVDFLEHHLTPAEVIGVAADGKYRTLGEEPRPFLYGNLLQNFPGGTLVVRAQSDLQPAFRDIRRQRYFARWTPVCLSLGCKKSRSA